MSDGNRAPADVEAAPEVASRTDDAVGPGPGPEPGHGPEAQRTEAEPQVAVALDERERRELLDLALASVGEELRTGERLIVLPADHPRPLDRTGATFVTLEGPDGLLGCIGSIEAKRSLVLDVVANARAAAFEDPRLPPLTADDWPEMTVKVSVLSPLEPMPAGSIDEVLGWLRPGVDGVLLAVDRHRGTFLPSVWEKVPEPEAFLHQLLAKAGLPPAGWPAAAKVWRYTTTECTDPAPRPPL